MKIGIVSDHRGYRLKEKLVVYLKRIGHDIKDLGCDGKNTVDYPSFAFELGNNVVNKNVDLGIAICGSGIGISIACNKVKGIRCAKVDSIKEAKLTRLDNDANVLALNGAMPTYKAKDIVDAFLKTEFSNLERHKRRIEQIDNYEKAKKTRAKKKEAEQDEC